MCSPGSEAGPLRIWPRWSERKSQAFLLGIRHGVSRVGCCWCLMLLIFFTGSANIGLILALGAVVAAEQNLPAGRRLAAPIGADLLLATVWVALTGTTA